VLLERFRHVAERVPQARLGPIVKRGEIGALFLRVLNAFAFVVRMIWMTTAVAFSILFNTSRLWNSGDELFPAFSSPVWNMFFGIDALHQGSSDHSPFAVNFRQLRQFACLVAVGAIIRISNAASLRI